MRVLVTRPIADGAEIARRLADLGHEALLAPLLTVRFHEGAPLVLDGVQAVLATSANGVRALAARTQARDVPVFAVGPQTAAAAREAGFIRVRSAEGDAAALAGAVSHWADPAAGPLLHVAGEDGSGRLAETLAAGGFQLRREVLYRVEAAAELPPAAVQALREGAVQAALFFSPRSARVFTNCALRAGLSMRGVGAVCISAGTSQALAGLAFDDLKIAAAPNQDALLACL